MKISLNWLKRYIDIDFPVDKLSEILTDIGLEVEGIEYIEGVKGGLEGIVVGKILSCAKHPNADKLSITKVDIGGPEELQIVCGAPNVAADQKVLVASIGTTLYSPEGEPWKIKKGNIRGEASEGMICAEDELGLGNDHAGIMILDSKLKVGTPAKDVFDLDNDVVFEIGLTPNRSDATSHLGVAQDLAAYLKINEGWTGNVKMPDVGDFKVGAVTMNTTVDIRNETACPRYSGVNLSNIKIGESPKWMQTLLKAVGVRPISNVVDITNFVLHELGQPLHAFDYDRITDQGIIVDTLKEGSKFVSLDETERTLSGEDLMICDKQKNPMCIAGVFGGLNSGVTDTTDKIFLEAAHFDAGYIRKTSTRHLLRTDAAKIFEKGSDPSKTVFAVKRAALLLEEFAGAHISSEIVDIYPTEILPRDVVVKYNNINRLIGANLEKEEVHEILRAMKMELKPVDENSMIVMIPTNKADVNREVDVIEEILRIYGFNKVEIPTQLKTTIHPIDYPTKRDVQNLISDFLTANGFNEIMGISLIESGLYQEDNSLANSMVYINNTSNIHLDVMRPDALKSGLRSVLHNLNHQQGNLRLFEFGKTYQTAEDGFDEFEFLSFFLCGKSYSEGWNEANKSEADLFDIKKWVQRTLNRLGIQSYQTSEIDGENGFDYGLKYHRGPMDIVSIGKVSSKVLTAMGISQNVHYALFDYRNVFKFASKNTTEIKEISKYPVVRRDIALVLDEATKFEDIQKLTFKTEKQLIRDINLFDIYKNEKHLGKGKKSYAISFTFQDDTKTLRDKDVDKVVNKLVSAFESKLQAQIRS